MAKKSFNNYADLESHINSCIEKAMKATRNKIFEIVSEKVEQYYEEEVFSPPNESEPDEYIRTFKLRDSLQKGKVELFNNKYSFMVGWDDDYLEFTYAGNPTQRISSINPATGASVLFWFNNESHGKLVGGEHKYWDEAIDEIESTYGSVEDMFLFYLKKYGIDVS